MSTLYSLDAVQARISNDIEGMTLSGGRFQSQNLSLSDF